MNHCHKDIIAVLDEHTEGHLANLKGQMLDGQHMDAHSTICQNLLAVCFLYADAHCTSTVHKYHTICINLVLTYVPSIT